MDIEKYMEAERLMSEIRQIDLKLKTLNKIPRKRRIELKFMDIERYSEKYIALDNSEDSILIIDLLRNLLLERKRELEDKFKQIN